MPSPFDLDLSQLRILATLLETRSVTVTASQLGRPQSSISSALGRLRLAFGDPLFVRGPGGLLPTPRALELGASLKESLDTLATVLAPPLPFDPATSTRTFTIAASDYTQFVLAGPLMELVQQEAPGVKVAIRALDPQQSWPQLGDGRLDLLIGGRMKPPEGLRSRRLFEDEVVCIVRRRHPVLASPWNLDGYLQLGHVEVQNLRGPTLADQALAALGASRRVQLSVPHFLVAPFVVLRTDFCFTLARRIAGPLSRLVPLELLPLPFPAEKVSIRAYWHGSAQNDAGHRWLRDQIQQAAPPA